MTFSNQEGFYLYFKNTYEYAHHIKININGINESITCDFVDCEN